MDEEDDYYVAYLGPEGTFSEEAARKAFKDRNANFLPFGTILTTAEAVVALKASFAVIPSENSIEGSVNIVTDFILTHPTVRIAGELFLNVSQNLIGARKIPLSTVRTVVSHPQALAQSRRWLRQNVGDYAEVETQSTAYAIASLNHFGDSKTTVAIGTSRAAQLYKRVVLFPDIQDSSNNTTRFWVIGLRDSPPSNNDKSVLLFLGVSDISRFISLLGSLSKRYKIEILRIESRPTKRGLGSYYFLIEIRGHRLGRNVKKFLDWMKQKNPFVKIRAVGSFPSIS